MRLFLSTFIFCASLLGHELNIITPIKDTNDYHGLKALIGKRLFTDTRFSKDGTISCATCHAAESFGTDTRKTSKGIGGAIGDINAPTTFNSRFNFAQFHDGRAKDLKEQAVGPIENPIEMGNKLENVLKTVKEDKYYQTWFKKLYKNGITMENIVDAIVEFERALVTTSRFDTFLLGDKSAYDEREQRGFKLFKEYGCIACHNGVNLGGNLYQKLGIFKDYNGSSAGRYNVTKEPKDKNYFKVPTLRNIAWTFPYLHDGSIESLEKTIKFMGEYQLWVNIPKNEVKDMEYFLNSLTGGAPSVTEE